MKALLIKLKSWNKKRRIIKTLRSIHFRHKSNENFEKFIANELTHEINGDKRNGFQKITEKCRILRLECDIHNADYGGC
ncbi:MAG: hypothetical protein US71_C0008G0009 [Parcubacteria group bacterium GW2011_GWD2_38_12]|nr:MAG: hypothetical protein US06_C0014G0008 [Parcubacteria group bacterium GW2011_GWC2_36_17]KKQ39308.1 MAG: hypothetical protein US56_C0020G0008 [Candidatus Moranbacteria bacterium GW2011_GWF2_37_7]KKQ43838.1 MAG: hypothetical protein US61_C0002G0003 [Parcubacteria group bacterium GW2011_GWE2_37_8]KKQ51736.1 MAG: hypothetical protein US71_C0008G0009 [Parcubacteria group bacterium GW2011_GWD2_38_12]KKQ58181.1 MAG: hypothetical protein US78_C0021G0003 [Parcubacteria group bacterium GW2011_GWD1_